MAVSIRIFQNFSGFFRIGGWFSGNQCNLPHRTAVYETGGGRHSETMGEPVNPPTDPHDDDDDDGLVINQVGVTPGVIQRVMALYMDTLTLSEGL